MIARILRLLPLALPLAVAGCASAPGCGLDTCTTYPTDLRERHPILLSEQPTRLDVFPRWAFGLDARQADEVRSFAQAFKRSTMSRIVVSVPTVGVTPTPLVKSSADAIRKVLVAARIEQRAIEWRPYDASAMGSASPITLAYSRLTAAVPHACNEWPEDLATASGFQWFQNEPYYSLGCSTQTNLAMAVADPLDLVRPRIEGPADAATRVADIAKLRDGQDPSTSWKASGSQNGSSGAASSGAQGGQ